MTQQNSSSSYSSPFCIVFYCGYSPNFHDGSESKDEGCFGSELATRNLAIQFKHQIPQAEIHIFCAGNFTSSADSNGIIFHNTFEFQEFQTKYWLEHNNSPIDILIVSRYIHFFLEFVPLARKILLWLHDVAVQPAWDFKTLPQDGKCLFVNSFERINEVVTLSKTHRNYLIDEWIGKSNHFLLSESQQKKVKIIGNGLNLELFSKPVLPKRKPNSIIYCSDPIRGLEQALDVFEQIQKQIPDATFYIYYKIPDELTLKRIASMTGVYIKGKVPHEQLAIELQTTEVWLYPSIFFETYCMSALEAQAAGCLCVAAEYGAVKDTLGEGRGALISGDPKTKKWQTEAANMVVQLLQIPEEEKEVIRNRARSWALDQNWENIADQWFELF